MAEIFFCLWDRGENHYWASLSIWIYDLNTKGKALLLVVKNYYRLSLEVEVAGYEVNITINNLETHTFPYSVLAQKYKTR